MNKSWFYLGVIGSLAILMTSCGGDGSKPATPAASPAASPAAAAPTAPIATNPTPTVPATPTTAPAPIPGTAIALKPVSVDVAAGLIPPTDGDNWAKTVSKGRSDPFAVLTLQPVEAAEIIDPLKPPKTASIASNNSPVLKSGVKKSLTGSKSGTKIASNGLNTKKGYGGLATSVPGSISISAIPRTGINRALPKIVVALPTTKTGKATTISKAVLKTGSNKPTIKISALPKIKPVQANTAKGSKVAQTQTTTQIAAKPEKIAEKPLQAMALEISGVIEVDGKTQVIVKLPNESFSRYVEIGDRVANGTVLIKRVEDRQTLSPTIVVEEVGIEVPRQVGDKSTPIAPGSEPKR